MDRVVCEIVGTFIGHRWNDSGRFQLRMDGVAFGCSTPTKVECGILIVRQRTSSKFPSAHFSRKSKYGTIK